MSISADSKRIQVIIPASWWAEMVKRAKREGRSVSNWVQVLVRQALIGSPKS